MRCQSSRCALLLHVRVAAVIHVDLVATVRTQVVIDADARLDLLAEAELEERESLSLPLLSVLIVVRQHANVHVETRRDGDGILHIRAIRFSEAQKRRLVRIVVGANLIAQHCNGAPSVRLTAEMFLAVFVSHAGFELVVHAAEIKILRDRNLIAVVLVVLRAQANVICTAVDQPSAAAGVGNAD